MRAIAVYESMYGNTHQIAEAMAEGLSTAAETEVVSVHDATRERVETADLVVVGGPTHTHGLSHDSTRRAAIEAAEEPEADLEVDPDAAGAGIREWLEALGPIDGGAAAFDTRRDLAPVLTGRASKGIAKQLRRHGLELVVEPESFLVTKETHLEPHEIERARAWGQHLAEQALGR